MGLLDNLLGGSFDDPRTAATLQLAQGLLSAPKAMQGLSGGLLGYSQAMQEAKQRKAAEELRALQMQQAQMQLAQSQRLAEREKAQDAFRQSIPSPQFQAGLDVLAANGGVTQAGAAKVPKADPNAQLLHGAMQAGLIDPVQYMTALRKDNSPLITKAGDVARDPVTGRVLWQNDDKDSAPSAVKEYQFAVSQGYRGTFADFEIAKKRAGATAITVDQRGDNAYATAQGKEYSDMMAGLNKAGFSAPSQLRKLERMTQLLEGVDGGKLAPMGMDIASAANSLGIKLDPKLGNKEAAQALSREIAGGFRQPGTGPMTDKDFENFLMQVPDLSKTASGRKQITETMKAALNRDIKIAQMARAYERKNGRIDGGFMDEVALFIAENPVVGAPAGWKVQR